MVSCKLVALTRPVPGKEKEFHDWYQNVHLPELVNGFGMAGAQRYQLVAKMMGTDENEFLAIYDIDCDDPAAFMNKMGEAGASGKMTMTDSQDFSTTYTALFREYDKRVEPA